MKEKYIARWKERARRKRVSLDSKRIKWKEESGGEGENGEPLKHRGGRGLLRVLRGRISPIADGTLSHILSRPFFSICAIHLRRICMSQREEIRDLFRPTFGVSLYTRSPHLKSPLVAVLHLRRSTVHSN